EDHVAFIAARDAMLQKIASVLDQITGFFNEVASGNEEAVAGLRARVPLRELREFIEVVTALTASSFAFNVSPTLVTASAFGLSNSPSISALRVPLQELREFSSILQSMGPFSSNVIGAKLSDLRVPLDELR